MSLSPAPSLRDFARPGDPDDLPAFRRAALSGLPRIAVPAGQYRLDNRPAHSRDLSGVVTARGTLFDCAPGTLLDFTAMEMPLFVFTGGGGGRGGGLRNARLRFTGRFATTPPPRGLSYDLMTRCGAARTGRGADANVLRQVVLVMDCDAYLFENLTFESARPGDPRHGLNGCLYTAGHGRQRRARGGRVLNCGFFDCIMGHLATGQEGFEFGPYVSARRHGFDLAGRAGYAPGHVLYLSGWQPDWGLAGAARDASWQATIRDGRVRAITDHGAPAETAPGLCLAPLAMKGCERVTVGPLRSWHPEGLVQSFQAIRDCRFAPMRWIADPGRAPGGPVINSAPGDFTGNRFAPITLRAPAHAIRLTLGTTGPWRTGGNRFERISVTAPGRGDLPRDRLLHAPLDRGAIALDWQVTPGTGPTLLRALADDRPAPAAGPDLVLALSGPGLEPGNARVTGPARVTRTE